MSLIPFILDLADELHEFSRCLANGIDINDFGFGLYTGSSEQQPQQHQTQQQSSPQQQSPRRNRTSSFSSFWLPSKRHHPYSRIKSACCGKAGGEEGGNSVPSSPEKDVTTTTTNTPAKPASYSVVNKNGFQVSMNVKQFAPNELSVKTIDNCIVVEGRHDDKEDGHGVISRHFVRKYMLPKGYDPKDVLSTLSSDGILTVKAPPPPPPSAKNDESNERIVEIQPTPGPTQMVQVVVSAKDGTQPQKEATRKLSSPAARDECQLPEKRQKLDIAQEQQQEGEETTTDTLPPQKPTTQAPTIPAAETSVSTVQVVADAAAASANSLVGNENAEKKTAESLDDKTPQQEEEVHEDITDVETNANDEGIKAENHLEMKENMETDETDKTVEEEEASQLLSETNGEEGEGDCINNSSGETTEPVIEDYTASAPEADDVPVEAEVSERVTEEKSSNSTEKMEVDGEHDDVAETDEVGKIAESQDVAMLAGDDVDGEGEKLGEDKPTNDSEINNSTETSNNTATEETNAANTTGENPADPVAESNNTGNNKTTDDAESANDKVDDNDTETAVLPTETTKTTTTTTKKTSDIDDVALLKAAVTADSAEISAAEENALLSETIDSIKNTESPSAGVEKVECTLFAKNHLGNGNSAALVAKEEVAN
ncbi:uncharacterized protein LOC142234462 [Haematobia irritans]|uniref:uncharacterized protein LOC142234462 n=1 Tax=Haematobia irritans TaxID=7368 RepID=UPI003F4F9C17